jgi:molybdopterin adenylyltransferase
MAEVEIRVHIAVLVIATDPSRADPAAADVVAQKAVGGGHSIVARVTVGDSIDAIRAQLKAWIDDPEIDVAIVTASSDTQHASASLKPLVHEAVPGFTDLFRWLAFQEIGASAMMASAEAARCGTTFVFVLPAVANAAGTAMDKLILPQLDVRANTRNLVAQMPRLQHLSPSAQRAPSVPSAPIVADASDKTEAVPTQVTMERTESGPGLTPRLPAQNIVRKEPAPPKPKPEEATRIISPEQLERKIQQSNQHDAVTKPNVDIAKLLPRVPPGADDLDDDETAEIPDVLSPQPFAPGIVKTPAPARKPPSVQIPVRTKPPTNAPIVLKKDESGRVMLPVKDPASGAIGKAKSNVVVDEVPTVPSKTPAKLAEAMKPKPVEVVKLADLAKAVAKPVEPPKSVEPEKPVEPPKPRVSTSMPVEDSELEEVEPTPAPPPPKRTQITTPPPMPIIAEVRARTREPTPLPLLPKRSKADEDALPRGNFVYPIKKSRTGRNIAIFLVLAVVAAGAGVAFVRFVIQKPVQPKQELATVPVVSDAAEVVAPPPVPVDAQDMPEIDIEPGSAGSAATPTPPPPVHVPTTPHHQVVHADAGVAVATAPVDAAAAEPPIEDGCDEVTCVTNHYEKACCARWKPADQGYHPHVGIADSLDKVMVREGIDGVKPRVIACGEQNAAKGIVKLAVSVGSDGSVKSVSVVDAPLPALGECVAAAVKLAQFAKTAKGGSFNYPFAF